MMRRGILGVLFMGVAGVAMARTYEIAEPDLLQELKNSRDEVIAFLEKGRKKLKEKVEDYEGEELTPAKKNRTYYVDPTYCLEEDIYYREGNKWRVLYPKGYCFNPVDYIPYNPPPMVVFNPCRKKEREWVEDYIKDKTALLVVSGCPVRKVSRQGWKVPVYYLLPELREKLHLSHTVSVISVDRERKAVRVEEIDVTAGSKGKAPAKSKRDS